MNVNDMIQEIKDDNQQVQDLAFKLYCKHTLKMALERYQTDKARVFKSQKYLDSITEETLRIDFENYDAGAMVTNKENWAKRAIEQLNK